jgi:hypothetical protein
MPHDFPQVDEQPVWQDLSVVPVGSLHPKLPMVAIDAASQSIHPELLKPSIQCAKS